MSVTITLNDANNDGTGINFLSYLSGYDASFVQDGWGGFNNSDPFEYSGTEYAIQNTGAATSVVMGSAAGDTLDYNFGSHVLEGSLDSVSFGSGLTLDTVNYDYVQTTVDIEITGLDLTGTGSGNDVHNVAYDLMGGNDDELLDEFDSGITYISSSGNDVMAGFAGDDTFVFNSGSGFDTVNSFDTNGDVLDVSGWGALSTSDLFVYESGGDSYVYNTSDYSDYVKVTGVTGLDAADYVFA